LRKSEIEKFRNYTFDTISFIPKLLIFRAFTNSCSKYLTSFTWFTIPCSWIPNCFIRARSTLSTIKVWIYLWTRLTDTTGDAIDLIFTTIFAFILVVVEIVRMIAWDTKSAIEE
jgi:hypothetical protein